MLAIRMKVFGYGGAIVSLVAEIAFVVGGTSELSANSRKATDFAALKEGDVADSLVIHAVSLHPRRWRQVNSQRRHVAPHRSRKLDQRYKGQVVFASLDTAHIAAIKPSFVRQTLLRHTKLAPFGTDALAENVEIWVHAPKSLIG